MMGRYDDAQDLTAKAFLKAFVGFKKFRKNCSFKTWVTAVAINLVKNYWRDKKPISSMECMNEDVGFIPVEGDDGPEDTMISEENKERINQAVCQLPMKFRPFVVMRHMQDMSYEEIAEANDVPVTTVRNRIHQGKKLLEEILVGSGIAQKTEDGYELT